MAATKISALTEKTIPVVGDAVVIVDSADNLNKKVALSNLLGRVVEYPIAAATTIVANTMVCVNASGYLVPAADTDPYRFAGIAVAGANNSAGADGALSVRVWRKGIFTLTASGLTQAMVGLPMFVLDSSTVQHHDDADFDVCVGTLVKYISAVSGQVDINTITKLLELT